MAHGERPAGVETRPSSPLLSMRTMEIGGDDAVGRLAARGAVVRRLPHVCALTALLAAAPAAAQVGRVETSGPPPFGLLLGDVFTLTTRVDVAAPFRLDRSALPKPGPITYALDLRSLGVAEGAAPGGGTRYEIKAEYQTFYAPLETIEQTAPPLALAFTDGAGRRVEAKSGQWTYLTSPLRPVAATAGGGGGFTLRPDAAPRPISVRRAAIEVGAAVGAALAALVLLAWSRAWPPFHRRPSRPFARAARAVARQAKAGEAGRKAAMLALHRAFDAAAGRRLFGDDVRAFLAARPAFQRLEPAVAAFFEASRAAFFGARGSDGGLGSDALARLARDLARAERAS